jgi:hypothetical protein
MKIRIAVAGTLALLWCLTSSLNAAEGTTRLDAMPGSKVRLEGTSSLHDWQVEAPFIGGHLDAGANFPLSSGQELKPGKAEAKGDAWITVRALKSIEKDGKPYSDKMDSIMWDKLKQPTNPRITYRISELNLKEAPKAKDAPYLFDSTGELGVAGVTNKISMPVNITVLGDKKVKITGNTMVKMSDFSIQPQTIGLGLFKTGDEVKILFEWVVGQKAPAAASSK